MNQENKDIEQKVDLTVDEIQAIMDQMDKKTFGAIIGMEWEGSIQNAPVEHSERK